MNLFVLNILDKIISAGKCCKHVFYAALFTAVILSFLSVFFSYDIYRDTANVYAYYAREIATEGIAAGWVARVPMLNILLGSILTALGICANQSMIIVSCIFYIATVFSLRRYLELFVSPLQAAWGCFLFVIAPKLIRFSVTGLIDSARYFFLITALFFFFRLVRCGKMRDVVFLGLALGGITVSRGESIIMLPLLLGVLLVLPLFSQGSFSNCSWYRNIKNAVCVSVISAMVISPFCAVNYYFSGYFVPDLRMAEALYPQLKQKNAVQLPGMIKETSSALQKTGDTLGDFFRGSYEPYFLLALLGMVLLIYRKKWRWEYTFMIVLVLLHLGIYYKITSAYRYSLYVIPLFMPFTVIALTFLKGWYEKQFELFRAKKICDILLAACVIAVIFSQLYNGLEVVYSRDDIWKRQIASYIRSYQEKNIPSRRVRVAALRLPEAVFWSGGESVFSYKSGIRDIRTFRDFDLLLIPQSYMKYVLHRKDLIKLPLPVKCEYVLFKNQAPVTAGEIEL